MAAGFVKANNSKNVDVHQKYRRQIMSIISLLEVTIIFNSVIIISLLFLWFIIYCTFLNNIIQLLLFLTLQNWNHIMCVFFCYIMFIRSIHRYVLCVCVSSLPLPLCPYVSLCLCVFSPPPTNTPRETWST
jgi:hypothetical protein